MNELTRQAADLLRKHWDIMHPEPYAQLPAAFEAAIAEAEAQNKDKS